MKRTASPFVVSLSNHERMQPSRSTAARGQSLFGIAPKVTKNASPCNPLHPAVLATGGMRIATTGAIRSKVCADDASTTARCCAPRLWLKGRMLHNIASAVLCSKMCAGSNQLEKCRVVQ